MQCHDCDSEVLAYTVPEEYRSLLPESVPGVATCTVCLSMQPVEDPPSGPPDLQAISDAFPSSPEAAVPMALAVGLLSSLALNRQAISTLLAEVEQAGGDPMLVLSRLIDDPDIDSHVDLVGRRRQLDQLL